MCPLRGVSWPHHAHDDHGDDDMTKSRARRATRRNINPNDLTGRRVGLYCRVSRDPKDKNDPERGKSTGDQADEGRAWVDRVGAHIVDTYTEPESRSASRFATKAREEYERL